MALNKRIARLLAGGFKANTIACITGASVTQIHQLIQDPEFKAQVEYYALYGDDESEEVTESELEQTEERQMRDTLKLTEAAALDALRRRIEDGLMEDRNLISALQVVSQRRDALAKQESINKALAGGTASDSIPTVVINLPSIVLPELNISSRGEIVGIGSRSTIPLGREAVTALIEGELANEQLSAKGATSAS